MRSLPLLLIFVLLTIYPLFADPLYPNTPSKDVFADAPWRLQPGRPTFPVLVVVKDAGDYIDDYDVGQVVVRYEGTIIGAHAFNIRISDEAFNLYDTGDWYGVFDVPIGGLPRDLPLRLDVTIEENGESYDPDGDAYSTLYIVIASDSLPRLPGWYIGDMHFHSHYTDNVYEFGGPTPYVSGDARAIGLDWAIVTDHSMDLTDNKWLHLNNDCINYSSYYFVLIRGEEVSCRNSDGDFVHFGVAGNNTMFNGSEITGTGPTVTQVANGAFSQGAISYAAHPEVGRDLFRVRGNWTDVDYQTPNMTGLQIWNTTKTGEDWYTYMRNGLDKWKAMLQNGRRTFIYAGSDAHGDFNHERYYDISISVAEDFTNAFGQARTVAYLGSQTLNQTNILAALRDGHAVLTDGPMVTMSLAADDSADTRVTAQIGDELRAKSNFQLTLNWKSSADMGQIQSIRVYWGQVTSEDYNIDDVPAERVFTYVPSGMEGSAYVDFTDSIPTGVKLWYRLEAATNRSWAGHPRMVLSNPIWVYRIPPMQVAYHLRNGWNLLSFPMQVTSGTLVRSVLPGVSQLPWVFSTIRGDYANEPNVRNELGYFVITDYDTAFTLTGYQRYPASTTLYPGWNCIGVPDTIPAESLRTNPAGILYPGSLWEFDPDLRDYVNPTVFVPGKGYWFLAARGGTLLFR